MIINGFQNPICGRILEKAFLLFPVRYCLYICQPEEYIPSFTAVEREFHHIDLKRDEDHVDWDALRPLDGDLIEKMRECEAVFLTMMTRYEKRQIISYQERKRRYLRQLRYWNHVLEERSIGLFLANNIPHEGCDYIIYALCKLKNIPTLFFYQDPIKDRLLLLKDWEDPIPGLRKRVEKLKREHALSERPVELSSTFEKHYTLQTQMAKGQGTVPWYMHRPMPPSVRRWHDVVLPMLLRDLPNFMRHAGFFLTRPFTQNFWSRIMYNWRKSDRERTMFNFYDAHTVIPDLSRQYLYVPLHMQPECSTCPMAGAFNDQLLIVQMLSTLLPPGILLYVKEHPVQRDVAKGRDIAFYKDLVAVSQVRLVPQNYNTFHLLAHCIAVATATGEAGFEALFREKPVFMFGHRFYQYAPGVFPIHTVEECKEALHAILERGMKPLLPDVRIFLKALEEVCITGCIDTTYQKMTVLSEEENVHSVSCALTERLQRILPSPVP